MYILFQIIFYYKLLQDTEYSSPCYLVGPCYLFYVWLVVYMGFPGSSDSKVSAYNAGDPGSIPGLGRSPGEGNGNPLQCSCLENSMDWGAWRATVHGVSKSRHDWHFSFSNIYVLIPKS